MSKKLNDFLEEEYKELFTADALSNMEVNTNSFNSKNWFFSKSDNGKAFLFRNRAYIDLIKELYNNGEQYSWFPKYVEGFHKEILSNPNIINKCFDSKTLVLDKDKTIDAIKESFSLAEKIKAANNLLDDKYISKIVEVVFNSKIKLDSKELVNKINIGEFSGINFVTDDAPFEQIETKEDFNKEATFSDKRQLSVAVGIDLKQDEYNITFEQNAASNALSFRIKGTTTADQPYNALKSIKDNYPNNQLATGEVFLYDRTTGEVITDTNIIQDYNRYLFSVYKQKDFYNDTLSDPDKMIEFLYYSRFACAIATNTINPIAGVDNGGIFNPTHINDYQKLKSPFKNINNALFDCYAKQIFNDNEEQKIARMLVKRQKDAGELVKKSCTKNQLEVIEPLLTDHFKLTFDLNRGAGYKKSISLKSNWSKISDRLYFLQRNVKELKKPEFSNIDNVLKKHIVSNLDIENDKVFQAIKIAKQLFSEASYLDAKVISTFVAKLLKNTNNNILDSNGLIKDSLLSKIKIALSKRGTVYDFIYSNDLAVNMFGYDGTSNNDCGFNRPAENGAPNFPGHGIDYNTAINAAAPNNVVNNFDNIGLAEDVNGDIVGLKLNKANQAVNNKVLKFWDGKQAVNATDHNLKLLLFSNTNKTIIKDENIISGYKLYLKKLSKDKEYTKEKIISDPIKMDEFLYWSQFGIAATCPNNGSDVADLKTNQLKVGYFHTLKNVDEVFFSGNIKKIEIAAFQRNTMSSIFNDDNWAAELNINEGDVGKVNGLINRKNKCLNIHNDIPFRTAYFVNKIFEDILKLDDGDKINILENFVIFLEQREDIKILDDFYYQLYYDGSNFGLNNNIIVNETFSKDKFLSVIGSITKQNVNFSELNQSLANSERVNEELNLYNHFGKTYEDIIKLKGLKANVIFDYKTAEANLANNGNVNVPLNVGAPTIKDVPKDQPNKFISAIVESTKNSNIILEDLDEDVLLYSSVFQIGTPINMLINEVSGNLAAPPAGVLPPATVTNATVFDEETLKKVIKTILSNPYVKDKFIEMYKNIGSKVDVFFPKEKNKNDFITFLRSFPIFNFNNFECFKTIQNHSPQDVINALSNYQSEIENILPSLVRIFNILSVNSDGKLFDKGGLFIGINDHNTAAANKLQQFILLACKHQDREIGPKESFEILARVLERQKDELTESKLANILDNFLTLQLDNNNDANFANINCGLDDNNQPLGGLIKGGKYGLYDMLKADNGGNPTVSKIKFIGKSTNPTANAVIGTNTLSFLKDGGSRPVAGGGAAINNLFLAKLKQINTLLDDKQIEFNFEDPRLILRADNTFYDANVKNVAISDIFNEGNIPAVATGRNAKLGVSFQHINDKKLMLLCEILLVEKDKVLTDDDLKKAKEVLEEIPGYNKLTLYDIIHYFSDHGKEEIKRKQYKTKDERYKKLREKVKNIVNNVNNAENLKSTGVFSKDKYLLFFTNENFNIKNLNNPGTDQELKNPVKESREVVEVKVKDVLPESLSEERKKQLLYIINKLTGLGFFNKMAIEAKNGYDEKGTMKESIKAFVRKTCGDDKKIEYLYKKLEDFEKYENNNVSQDIMELINCHISCKPDTNNNAFAVEKYVTSFIERPAEIKFNKTIISAKNNDLNCLKSFILLNAAALNAKIDVNIVNKLFDRIIIDSKKLQENAVLSKNSYYIKPEFLKVIGELLGADETNIISAVQEIQDLIIDNNEINDNEINDNEINDNDKGNLYKNIDDKINKRDELKKNNEITNLLDKLDAKNRSRGNDNTITSSLNNTNLDLERLMNVGNRARANNNMSPSNNDLDMATLMDSMNFGGMAHANNNTSPSSNDLDMATLMDSMNVGNRTYVNNNMSSSNNNLDVAQLMDSMNVGNRSYVNNNTSPSNNNLDVAQLMDSMNVGNRAYANNNISSSNDSNLDFEGLMNDSIIKSRKYVNNNTPPSDNDLDVAQLMDNSNMMNSSKKITVSYDNNYLDEYINSQLPESMKSNSRIDTDSKFNNQNLNKNNSEFNWWEKYYDKPNMRNVSNIDVEPLTNILQQQF